MYLADGNSDKIKQLLIENTSGLKFQKKIK